jgi:hypothetical protein
LEKTQRGQHNALEGTDTNDGSNLLNVQQLDDFLGVKLATVHGLTRQRARRTGEPTIPLIKTGRRLYFRRESVERWIAERETT